MSNRIYNKRFDDALRIRLNGDFCVYCGEWADTMEHYPPASMTPVGLLLPACRECNGLAGTAFCSDFRDRVALVRSKLQKRYDRELSSIEWSEEEIASLSYSLRISVREWDRLVKKARTRMAWNAFSYLVSIDPDGLYDDACERLYKYIEAAKDSLKIRQLPRSALGSTEPTTYQRVCISCGAEFETRNETKKCCSSYCRSDRLKLAQAQNVVTPKTTRICSGCGNAFTAKHEQFCRRSCRYRTRTT